MAEDNYGAGIGSAVAEVLATHGGAYTLTQMHVRQDPKSVAPQMTCCTLVALPHLIWCRPLDEGDKIMRYEVTTRMSPQEAITYAKDYFGPQGVGLQVMDENELWDHAARRWWPRVRGGLCW